ncbi:MAG: hypothetical protein IPG63_15950 [Xanthomonadales bacterium]|nr:hypothetical protein [Xanthomonadales bacterium]
MDSWRRPIALSEGVGVYSFGADGIDDRGEKDDIASWRPLDPNFYPKPPIRLQDLPLLLIQPALLLSLFGIPAWWVFGRRKPAGVRR